MLSVTSIVGVIIGGVLAYFLWKMLKTIFVVIGVTTVLVGAVLWWAHSEPSTTNTAAQNEQGPPTGLVENSARWVARPIHDAAKQIVNLTQDEEQFVKTVQESSSNVDSWLQQAEAVKAKLPIHLLTPSAGSLSQKEVSPPGHTP